MPSRSLRPKRKPAPLPRAFYLRPTLTVARELLGKIFTCRERGRELSGRIVEVEAYLGREDPAAHTFKGQSERNRVMFMEGGHLYFYFTYGMHYCANVVTEAEGIGHACLIRAIEPLSGIEMMRSRRNVHRDIDLTNGPAKLCQAMGIDLQKNGTDLVRGEIFISNAPIISPDLITTSTRVGISKGKDHPWRFFIKGNPFVSRH